MAKSREGDATCDVAGCESPAERSLSSKKVEGSKLELKDSAGRRIHLCKEHYRQFKKETKTDRSLENLGR